MLIVERDLTKDLHHIAHYEDAVTCDDGLITLVSHARRWHDCQTRAFNISKKTPKNVYKVVRRCCFALLSDSNAELVAHFHILENIGLNVASLSLYIMATAEENMTASTSSTSSSLKLCAVFRESCMRRRSKALINISERISDCFTMADFGFRSIMSRNVKKYSFTACDLLVLFAYHHLWHLE